MNVLTRADLLSLEDYSQQRAEFRQQVMNHKKNRHVQLGDHLRLLFEDRLTVQYQIQEMLRVERIFESAGIQEELEAYNPLIPDGDNWKATMMIEFPDVAERKTELGKLIGVEDSVWVRVGEMDSVYAIADEDIDRETDEKTSSVHFLRFQLTADMIGAAKAGEAIAVGVDHSSYSRVVDPLAKQCQDALVADLS